MAASETAAFETSDDPKTQTENYPVDPASASTDWNMPMSTQAENVSALQAEGWAITPGEYAVYDGHFNSLNPVNGRVLGVVAKEFLVQSKLHLDTLAHIWRLADITRAGSLDNEEFAVAVHLVQRALKGEPLPTTLPPELMPPSARARESTHDLGAMAALLWDAMDVPWVVESRDKAVYDGFFAQYDREGLGVVAGTTLLPLFEASHLPQSDLARVWQLVDFESTGYVDADQFALAMHLTHLKRKGGELPSHLPLEFIPPKWRAYILAKYPERFMAQSINTQQAQFTGESAQLDFRSSESGQSGLVAIKQIDSLEHSQPMETKHDAKTENATPSEEIVETVNTDSVGKIQSNEISESSSNGETTEIASIPSAKDAENTGSDIVTDDKTLVVQEEKTSLEPTAEQKRDSITTQQQKENETESKQDNTPTPPSSETQPPPTHTKTPTPTPTPALANSHELQQESKEIQSGKTPNTDTTFAKHLSDSVVVTPPEPPSPRATRKTHARSISEVIPIAPISRNSSLGAHEASQSEETMTEVNQLLNRFDEILCEKTTNLTALRAIVDGAEGGSCVFLRGSWVKRLRTEVEQESVAGARLNALLAQAAGRAPSVSFNQPSSAALLFERTRSNESERKASGAPKPVYLSAGTRLQERESFSDDPFANADLAYLKVNSFEDPFRNAEDVFDTEDPFALTTEEMYAHARVRGARMFADPFATDTLQSGQGATEFTADPFGPAQSPYPESNTIVDTDDPFSAPAVAASATAADQALPSGNTPTDETQAPCTPSASAQSLSEVSMQSPALSIHSIHSIGRTPSPAGSGNVPAYSVATIQRRAKRASRSGTPSVGGDPFAPPLAAEIRSSSDPFIANQSIDPFVDLSLHGSVSGSQSNFQDDPFTPTLSKGQSNPSTLTPDMFVTNDPFAPSPVQSATSGLETIPSADLFVPAHGSLAAQSTSTAMSPAGESNTSMQDPFAPTTQSGDPFASPVQSGQSNAPDFTQVQNSTHDPFAPTTETQTQAPVIDLFANR